MPTRRVAPEVARFLSWVLFALVSVAFLSILLGFWKTGWWWWWAGLCLTGGAVLSAVIRFLWKKRKRPVITTT